MSLAQRNAMLAALAAVLVSSVTGCRAVAGIFKAGIWTGVIVVGLLLLLGFGATRLLARRT